MFMLYLMAGLYIAAGVNHFIMPRVYMRIMPLYLPWHRLLVYLSGIAEILVGVLLLFPGTRSLAAWMLIALLILIFPANIHHLVNQKSRGKIPVWVLVLRLPLQGLLIWWAWLYT